MIGLGRSFALYLTLSLPIL